MSGSKRSGKEIRLEKGSWQDGNLLFAYAMASFVLKNACENAVENLE